MTRLRPPVRPSVRPSVRLPVRPHWAGSATVPASILGLTAALVVLLLGGCGPAPDEPLRRWQVDAADLERGRQLMSQFQCGSCHAVPGVPGGGQRAPALERFGRRAYIAGQLPNSPEVLQRWLLDPPGLLPGTTMPRLGLSERDARDIAGYLLSLR
jgi:cytochrome c